jgi:hypothetical protein
MTYTLQSVCELEITFNSANLFPIIIVMTFKLFKVTEFSPPACTMDTEQSIDIPIEISWLCKSFLNNYS